MGLARLLGQQPTPLSGIQEPLVNLAVVEGAGGDQVVEVAGRLPQLPVALTNGGRGDPGQLLGQRRPRIAVTRAVRDGRELHWTSSDRWNMSFPAELAGYFGRFRPGAVVFGRDPAADKKSIIAVTTNGRLVQLWDTERWNSNFPAELARV
jgi:hypothetical protein